MDRISKFFSECWDWMAASVWALVLIVLLVAGAYFFSSTDGGFVYYALIVLLAVIVGYPGWKSWMICNPTAHTGVSTAILVAVFIAMECMLIGRAFMAEDAKFFGGFMGFAIGDFLGVYVAIYGIWNPGVFIVPTSWRAIVMWLRKRQEGHEIGEGLAWVPPFFGTHDDYDMTEQTSVIKKVPVELADGNLVYTDISLQWKNQSGQLFYRGNIPNVELAFTQEAPKAARAFGSECDGIPDFVENMPSESLEHVIYKYVNWRADGKNVKIHISRARDDTTGKKMPTVDFVDIIDPTTGEAQKADPWGIDIISVTVPNFDLPANYTKAAAEIPEAEARKKARALLDDNLVESQKKYTGAGVDPNVALAQSHATNMDDRASPHRTLIIPGLDKIAEGLAALAGSKK